MDTTVTCIHRLQYLIVEGREEQKEQALDALEEIAHALHSGMVFSTFLDSACVEPMGGTR